MMGSRSQNPQESIGFDYSIISEIERKHDSDKILIWTRIKRRYLNLKSSPCQKIYLECNPTAKDFI